MGGPDSFGEKEVAGVGGGGEEKAGVMVQRPLVLSI